MLKYKNGRYYRTEITPIRDSNDFEITCSDATRTHKLDLVLWIGALITTILALITLILIIAGKESIIGLIASFGTSLVAFGTSLVVGITTGEMRDSELKISKRVTFNPKTAEEIFINTIDKMIDELERKRIENIERVAMRKVAYETFKKVTNK